MATGGFSCDLMNVRIDTPNTHLQDAKLLTVGVAFTNTPLMITSSRINVAEFRSGYNFEF